VLPSLDKYEEIRLLQTAVEELETFDSTVKVLLPFSAASIQCGFRPVAESSIGAACYSSSDHVKGS